MKTEVTRRAYDGYATVVSTRISDADLIGCQDPHIILEMVRWELAHRITDTIMDQLEPKLQTMLEGLKCDRA